MKFCSEKNYRREILAVQKQTRTACYRPCLPNQTYFSMKKFYLYFLLVTIQKYGDK